MREISKIMVLTGKFIAHLLQSSRKYYGIKNPKLLYIKLSFKPVCSEVLLLTFPMFLMASSGISKFRIKRRLWSLKCATAKKKRYAFQLSIITKINFCGRRKQWMKVGG